MTKQNKSPVTEQTDVNPIFLHSDAAMSVENLAQCYTHMYGMIFRATLEYFLETARFFHRRLQEDLETAETFASYSNVSELSDEAMDFFERAMKEYGDETALLSWLGFGLATEAAEDVQREVQNTVKH